MARRRRVATRSWCSSSGSSPKRVPGSCLSSSETWRASAMRTWSSAGAQRGGIAGSAGKKPMARKAFGRPSPGVAPASSSARPRPGRASAPPSSASISTSTNDSRTRRPSRTANRSMVTSATACPFSCARIPARRVRRTAARSSPRPRRMPDQQVGEVRRRRGRPARRLQLEPLPLAGELELPDAPPVLDAPAERHAGACKRPVGRVEVGRGERAQLDRLARKVG